MVQPSLRMKMTAKRTASSGKSTEGALAQPTKAAVAQEDLSLRLSLDQMLDGFSGEVPRTATITLPDRSQLTVRLANVELLAELDDARIDSRTVEGAMWMLGGVILGALVSSVLDGNLAKWASSSSLILVLVSLGILAFLGFLWRRFSRRANRIRARIDGVDVTTKEEAHHQRSGG